MSFFGGLGWTIYTLSDDAKDLLESLPEATQRIRPTARSHRAAACVLNVAPCIGLIALAVAFAPVGVLAFGRLWGRVLGVPVPLMAKAVCDRVDDLKPIGELLGNRERDRSPPPRHAQRRACSSSGVQQLSFRSSRRAWASVQSLPIA